MIRTALSFCALFATLICFSKMVLQDTTAVETVDPAPMLTAKVSGDAEVNFHFLGAADVEPAAADVVAATDLLLDNDVVSIERVSSEESLPVDEEVLRRDLQELDGMLEEFLSMVDGSGELQYKPSPGNTEPAAPTFGGVFSVDAQQGAVKVVDTQLDDGSGSDAGEAGEAGADEEVVDESEAVPNEEIQPEEENDVQPELILSPELIQLREEVADCLAIYYFRPENVASRSPWGIMHMMLSFGVDTKVVAGNQKVNAAAWLCWNRPCRGMRLFYTHNRGEIGVRQGPGYEGHRGQFLAMLAQCRVRDEYRMRINNKDFTVADLVAHEARTCEPKSELTFKLIGLSHYLGTDAHWTDVQGRHWNVERLIREELAQPIVGAACGGTHRMMGFSYAVHRRDREGLPVTGQFARAQKYVDSYIDYLYRLQNHDGSFSTQWFEGRANEPDVERKLQTTGHMLEWLVFSLPENELDDPRVVKAVTYLTTIMLENQDRTWEVGPKGHAIRALNLYQERMFGGRPGGRDAKFAERYKKIQQR